MIRYGVFLLWILSLTVSCGEPVGGSGTSPVFLIAESGEDVYGLTIDVYDPTAKGHVTDDFFDISIKSKYKGEGNNPLIQTEFAEVKITEYRVTYYRLDGNPNVPDPFTIQCYVSVPAGAEGKINTIVVRREAKLKSPLKDLVFGGGEGVIMFNAVIEFFGEDLLGNHLSTRYILHLQALDI
jgi:hypothetical protein